MNERIQRVIGFAWTLVASLLLAACNGGVNSTDTSSSVTASEFTVGGTVSGLSGKDLVVQVNGAYDLPISANGTYTFQARLIVGSSYNVTVLTQPVSPNQTCVVSHGSGTVGTSNVIDIDVTCANKTGLLDTIGGNAVGVLGSGLVLQDDGGDNLAVPSNGAFTFATALPSGMPYNVSVLSPPINPYQDCVVDNGAGTTAGDNVNNVTVSCKTNVNPTYTIGGTVSGLSGTLVLQDDGRDNLTLSANGPFHFPIPIPSGSSYSVTPLSESGQQSQTCSFTNASGIVGNGNVTNVSVMCTANALVPLTVTGLTGSGLVLQDNGGDNLAVKTNGPITFATALAIGASYDVTVLHQPTNPSQTCVINHPVGTAPPGSASTVLVTCTTNTYTVGGTVSGLNGTGLVLRNNGVDLPVSASGAFVFPTPIPSGGSYDVTVVGQPVRLSQTCTVGAGTGSGPVTNANIISVTIGCTTNTYTVGGTVSGLDGTGLVLRNNGVDLPVSANGKFVFPMPIPSGGSYDVTVVGQPVRLSQTCTVGAGTGSGPVTNANIISVTIGCTTNSYTVSVTVSGSGLATSLPSDESLGLENNGVEYLPLISVNGTYAFPTSILSGGTYAVTVTTQPGFATGYPGQTSVVCNVVSGTGPVTNANVNVAVTCVEPAGFTYVTNKGDNTISGYVIDSTTGALVPFGNPVAAGTGPAAAIFDPIGYYELFVANKSSNTISSFAYDINIGVLTQAAPPIATGTAPTSLVGWNLTDTTGAVYVTNSGSSPGTVSTYSDNAGVLSAFGTSLSSGPDPTASLLSADADLFVTNAGANTVSNFAINQITGGLSSTGVIPDVTGAGPNSVAAGSLLSAGEFSGTATVTVGTAVLSVDSVAQGALAVGDVVSGTGIASGTTIVSFGTGTGGTGTYNLSAAATATVSTAESITGYAYSAYVAATATEVSGSNVLTVTSVTTGTLLVGDVLYAVGLPSGTSIVSFGTGAGGAGTYNLSAEATDSGEASVNVDNYQEYVFVGNSDGSISVLLNAMPGNGLTSLQQYPAAIAGLSAVAFYPLYLGATPGYLYAAGTNGVYVFATQGQALLTGQITGSPYAAGSSPSSITIFGHYLYVTNSGDGTVSGFVIDSTTGALTGIPGSPFPCGSAPSSIIATSRPESD